MIKIILLSMLLYSLTSCVTYDKCKQKYGMQEITYKDTIIYTGGDRVDTIINYPYTLDTNFIRLVTDTHYINKDNIKIMVQVKRDTLYRIKELKVDAETKKEEIKVRKQQITNTFKYSDKSKFNWATVAGTLFVLLLCLLAILIYSKSK